MHYRNLRNFFHDDSILEGLGIVEGGDDFEEDGFEEDSVFGEFDEDEERVNDEIAERAERRRAAVAAGEESDGEDGIEVIIPGLFLIE